MTSRMQMASSTYFKAPTLSDINDFADAVSAPGDAKVLVEQERPDPPYAAPNWTVELTWTA